MTGTRPRDFQRSKVYAAERAALPGSGGRTMDWVTNEVTRILDLPAIRALQDDPLTMVSITLRDGGGTRRASSRVECDQTVRLNFPRWSRKPWVLCHELAHAITERQHPGACCTDHTNIPAHGAEFAGFYLAIVAAAMGDEAAGQLAEQFAARKVQVVHPDHVTRRGVTA